jgi:hypothetical protein
MLISQVNSLNLVTYQNCKIGMYLFFLQKIILAMADVQQSLMPVKQNDLTREERIQVQVYSGLDSNS